MLRLLGSNLKQVLKQASIEGLCDTGACRRLNELIYGTVEFDALMYCEYNGFPRMQMLVKSAEDEQKVEYVGKLAKKIVDEIDCVVGVWDEGVKERGRSLIKAYYPEDVWEGG